MIWLLLYFLSCIVAFGIFAYFNNQYKWVTHESLRYEETHGILLFLGILLWPPALIILGVIILILGTRRVCQWIVKTFIPPNNP